MSRRAQIRGPDRRRSPVRARQLRRPFADAPAERVEEIAGVKFLLVHGDRYGVKSSLTRLCYRAEELGCQAALFGHTHSAFCGYAGAALLVNPGALRDGNYAEITLHEGKIVPRLLSL